MNAPEADPWVPVPRPGQWTRNRVWQYPHVATPNRSTLAGGAPQFGHGISIEPRGTCGPAGSGDCTMGGGGIVFCSPGPAIAIMPPPAIIRTNPSPAMRTGWTTPVTAAARVPNMNVENPAKMSPRPATFAGFWRDRTGRTDGTEGGWGNPWATAERGGATLDEASAAVRRGDSDAGRQAPFSSLTTAGRSSSTFAVNP